MATEYQIVSLPGLQFPAGPVDHKEIIKKFGQTGDFIELHIYDLNNTLLSSEIPFFDFQTPQVGTLSSEISIDPKKILRDNGFTSGKYILKFNIQRQKIFNLPLDSDQSKSFTIKEVSNSRTEIRTTTNNISNATLDPAVSSFISELETSLYFKEFNLNFGDDVNILGINIVLNKNPEKHEVLFKLNTPLPDTLDIGSKFSITETIVNPKTVDVNLGAPVVTDLGTPLRNANFKIDVKQKTSLPTDYKTYNEILQYDFTSSYNHLLSKLEDKEIPIIKYDYIKPLSGSGFLEPNYHFENFVHYSSATERIKNFKYKLKLIELYDKDINKIEDTSSGDGNSWAELSGSIYVGKEDIAKKKEKIIKEFDGYEKFLYFESGTYSWPKSNTTIPYTQHSVESSEAKTWLGSDDDKNFYYGGQLLSASLYDRNNVYSLSRTIPTHIIENSDNDYFTLFLNMVGQHFDYIWTYIKHITELYDTHHTQGISKDFVFYQLKSLGLEVFDQFENSSLEEYFLGYSSGSNFLAPTYYHQYGTSPGWEQSHPSSSLNNPNPWSETLVTSSNDGSIPKGDITKEIWKRIYHNVPYLLKTKGTERGLKALMSCYGIPSTILNIKEYGGPVVDKTGYKTFSYDKSGLALKGVTTNNEYFIKTKWSSSLTHEIALISSDNITNSATSSYGKTVEFRIKPKRIDNESFHLFSLSGSNASLDPLLILSPWTGNDISSSGDASTFGRIDLVMNGEVKQSTAYFPVYNGDFWNIFMGNAGISGSGGVGNTEIESGFIIGSTTDPSTYAINYMKFGAYQANHLKNVTYHTNSFFIGEPTGAYSFGDPYYQSGIDNSELGNTYVIGGYGGPWIGGANYAYFGGTELNDSSYYDNYDTLKYSGSLQEIKYHFNELLSHETLKKHALEPFMYSGNSISSSYTNVVLRLPLGSNDLENTSSFHPNIDVNYLGGMPLAATATWEFEPIQAQSIFGMPMLFVELTSAAGVTKRYVPTEPGDNWYAENGTQPDFEDFIVFQTGLGSGINAANFAAAVNGPAGHNGAIIATSEGNTITLTQATLGANGNTSITYGINSDPGGFPILQNFQSYLIVGNEGPISFSGGTDGISSTLPSPTWEEVIETHHLPTPDTVGASMTSEKVRIDEGVIDGNILHPRVKSEISTHDRQPLDYEDLGIFFSPTTEINEDILYTLGNFRLDDYIGSPLPSAQTSSKYEDLSTIKDYYFKKVKRRYNYWDYLKLIQNIDHTLFKMIEDFVPARSNLKTGFLIEPHYLERNKFARELPIRSDGQTMTEGSHQTFNVNLNSKHPLNNSLTGSMGGGSSRVNPFGPQTSTSSPTVYQGMHEGPIADEVVTTNNVIRLPYGPITTNTSGIDADGSGDGLVIGESFFIGADTDAYPEQPIKEQGTNCTIKIHITGSKRAAQAPIKPYGPTTSLTNPTTNTTKPEFYVDYFSSVLLGTAQKSKLSRKYYRELPLGSGGDIIDLGTID